MTAMLARAQAPPILFLPEIISSRSLSLALSLSISLSASTAYLRTPGCLLLVPESSSPRSREWKYFPLQRHFCHISLRGNLREVLRSWGQGQGQGLRWWGARPTCTSHDVQGVFLLGCRTLESRRARWEGETARSRTRRATYEGNEVGARLRIEKLPQGGE